MGEPVKNLRITFFGTRGSGSTFPDLEERADFQKRMDYQLLKNVFDELLTYADEDGRICRPLGDILGGPADKATIEKFRARFDIPIPKVFGGWSTCILVETGDGHDIVLDCGSGFRNCAKYLQKKWDEWKLPERNLYILGSHSHSDHTEGFEQATVCFDPRNSIHIYGNHQFLYALDRYLGVFSKHVEEDVLGLHTPINYAIMPARFRAIEIRDPDASELKGTKIDCEVLVTEQPFHIGETTITPFPVFHPIPCLAFKIEHGGKSFVYCTDHELRHGPDPEDQRQKDSLAAEARVRRYSQSVDVLYRDGQFQRSEYDGLMGIGKGGPLPRIDWGHSCIDDVQQMAIECNVKHTYIGHHDPNREWEEHNFLNDSLVKGSEGREEKVEFARAETTIDL